MRIVSHKTLKVFFETPGNEDAKIALERWYQIVEEAEWHSFADIKQDFGSVDYVGNQHYVFNISVSPDSSNKICYGLCIHPICWNT